jgi:hypothetical protein
VAHPEFEIHSQALGDEGGPYLVKTGEPTKAAALY